MKEFGFALKTKSGLAFSFVELSLELIFLEVLLNYISLEMRR